ncbi:MAG: DUF1573 domain-containing protein [Phycisphaerales bacterium]|nr:DUF1573 domain-containing protein [Phycisphaerales bacterium]
MLESNMFIPSRRGLAPKMILMLCGVAVLVLIIVFLGTSMNRKPAPRAVVMNTSTPAVTPPPAPSPTPPAPVDEASLEDAPVTITPVRFDFGLMKPGSATERTVQLRNVGTEPVRVLGSKKTCSCTQVDLKPTVLQPGQEIPVTATMTAGFRQSDKSSVKVVLQYADYKPTTIGIIGMISHAVSATPSDIRVHPKGYDEQSYRTSGVVELNSANGKPFQLIRSGGDEPVFHNPIVDSSDWSQQHRLRWNVDGYDRVTGLDAEGNLIPDFWLMETTHEDAPVVAIPLNHRVHRLPPRGQRPWFTIDQFAVVDPAEAGGSVDLVLPVNGNLGVNKDPIYLVESESPAFRADLISSSPASDGKAMNLLIRITPADTTRGIYSGRIMLKSSKWEAPFKLVGYARDLPGS